MLAVEFDSAGQSTVDFLVIAIWFCAVIAVPLGVLSRRMSPTVKALAILGFAFQTLAILAFPFADGQVSIQTDTIARFQIAEHMLIGLFLCAYSAAGATTWVRHVASPDLEDFLGSADTSRVADTGFGACRPNLYVRLTISLTRSLPENEFNRRLALVLRAAAMPGLRRPVDVEVLGNRMRLHLIDNVCDRRVLFTPQYFDPAELAELGRRMTDGFTFIDAGANVGMYSLFVARRAGASGRVLAIEPQHDIHARLAFNIGANGFGSRITAVRCAVADRDGVADMVVDRTNKGASTLVKGDGSAADLTVPCRTLASLMDEAGIDRADAIKLDIEGAEELVLSHFLGTAPRLRRPMLVIIERHGNNRAIQMLVENGYTVQKRTRRNYILVLNEQEG
ncbi:MAG: FkbM family methyltransferase [Inquilinus sp.]|uniref:FkbM family methyltransferase n=1 Tax=Inquilinus sp. TaxID=1932117 RepID=UPI003F3D4C6D